MLFYATVCLPRTWTMHAPHAAVTIVPWVQIHLGLSGTNSFWVMWATGTGKVCLTPLVGCTTQALLHGLHANMQKHHLPLYTVCILSVYCLMCNQPAMRGMSQHRNVCASDLIGTPCSLAAAT